MIRSAAKEDIEKLKICFESDGRTIAGTIYFPRDLSRKNPGVIFIGGWSSHRDIYRWIGEYLSSNEYVAFLIDASGNGGSEGIFSGAGRERGIMTTLISAIESPICFIRNWWKADITNAVTYLVKESQIRDFVSANRIGLMGHSMGGIAVSKIGNSMINYGKIKATVALSNVSLSDIGGIGIPIQIQTGDVDLGVGSYVVARPGYYFAKAPKQLIQIKGGTHAGFTDVGRQIFEWQKNVSKHYALAWFDYYLKERESAYDTLTSPHENLSFIQSSRYDFGGGEVGSMKGLQT